MITLRGALIGAFLALAGCSTAIQLTDEGQGVRHVSRADMPTSCNLLGDVAIGIPPDAARPRTEAELLILMRNKTGELGGNYFVLDSSNTEQDSDGRDYYRGRGIGYACPEEQASPEATMGGEQDTAGGEEPAADEDTGGGEEEEEPAPQVSEEEDAILDDLLGDD